MSQNDWKGLTPGQKSRETKITVKKNAEKITGKSALTAEKSMVQLVPPAKFLKNQGVSEVEEG